MVPVTSTRGTWLCKCGIECSSCTDCACIRTSSASTSTYEPESQRLVAYKERQAAETELKRRRASRRCRAHKATGCTHPACR